MLSFGDSQKTFLYGKPCDMRKGFNTLWGLVVEAMHLDPLCGYWFVLINSSRTHLKILHWEKDGIVIYYKRLEKGTFRRPSVRKGTLNSELTWEELHLILRGIDIEKTKKRARFLSQ